MTQRTESLPPYLPEHPAFAGHFPGRPIVPGVLLLDAVLHALGIDAPECRIASAKFLHPVAPGTALQLHAAPAAAGGWRFSLRGAPGEIANGQARTADAGDSE